MGEWTFEEPNPITSFRVGIEFERPLTADTFSKISSLHSLLRRDLPRKLEQQAVTLQIGPAPVNSPPPVSTLAGVTFDSLKPDGDTQRALSASQNAVTFMVANYSRWREFWPVAERMLRIVGEPTISDAPLKAFVLIAQNRFDWSAENDLPDLARLIKSDTKLVAGNMLYPHRGSHSFHGYFEQTQPPRGARLVNINVAIVTPPQGKWVCDMTFALRLILDNAISATPQLFESPPERESPADRTSALEAELYSLHDLNKKLLRDILIPSFVAQIEGLGA